MALTPEGRFEEASGAEAGQAIHTRSREVPPRPQAHLSMCLDSQLTLTQILVGLSKGAAAEVHVFSMGIEMAYLP